MPRPSVMPEIKKRLEDYLEGVQAAYEAQPEMDREPTLPRTGDWKANVQAIGRGIGLSEGQFKYLHERAELAGLVNAVATAQGLRPIGARNDVEQDPAPSGRLLQAQKAAKAAEQAAVESQATVQNLIDQLREAQETIANQAATIMRLQARLELIENGIFVEVR
jgi:hypothetical protein